MDVVAVQHNVVIVVADTTRADDAYTPAIAPTLAGLCDDGMCATRAFSTAPWTLPSHASLVTGTHPSTHGAYAGHERLDADRPKLQGRFRDAGYETACISNNTWLSVESGFDQGFDTFQQMWQLVQSESALGELVEVTEESRYRAVARKLFSGNPLVNAANALYRIAGPDRSDDGAARSTEWIAEWLRDRDDDSPFFLLANYLEPHLEYDPPRRLVEEYLPADATYEEARAVPQEPWEYLAGHVELSEREFRLLRGLYRAEIAYVDEQIGALRDALIEAGEWEDTIFVVTADHGENVGDHGLMDHQYCLYDTLVHVPLVLHGGPFVDRDDYTELVSLVDLPPTLLDAAGVDDPDADDAFQGRVLTPGDEDPSREFVVSEYMSPVPSMDALERHLDTVPEHVYELDRSLRAIRTEEYKLVRGSDGSLTLFDLDADPGETTDVAAANPTVVDDLEAKLDEWEGATERRETTESVSIGQDRKEQLEELGYLQ